MTIRLHISAALLASTLLPAAAGAQAPINTSWILHNGTIVTQNEARPNVSALAIFGDEIIAIGDDAEVLALRGANSCVLDLGGRTVVPGFADGHIHSKILRMDESTVNLTPVRNMQELLDSIAAKVARVGPGELVTTTSDWHEAQLEELRLPTRWDLDPISPDNPVVVIRGGHSYILNTAALERWGITSESESPPGGHIGFDRERGDITGELVDRAKDLVDLPESPPKTLEERLALLRDEHRGYNELGLTSIRNPGASLQAMHDYQELARRGDQTVRVSVLIRWNRRSSADAFRTELETWPVKSGFGDRWVRLDGIKLGVDGGYEGGWMTEPYEEPYGQGGSYTGLNTVPREQFTEVVKMLNELDIRPSTHAVGDAAIDLVLHGYEAADRERDINGRRWAIEHAFITRPDQIERIEDLGLVISAQSHLYLAGASLVEYWGRERAEQVAPVRSWLDAGIYVAGGTDNKLPYVPEDPLTTFYHWVTRGTVSAGVLGEDEAITREEALRIATIGNAYLTFEEDLKGRLEPGKLADLVVLSQNIMTVPADRLQDTRVLGTMVGGRFVYDTPELGVACSALHP